MKIAVTGANGFVGSNLVKHLSYAGHKVIVLVRDQANTALLPPDSDIRIIDYSDINSLMMTLNGVDIIIHNAGKTRALSYSQMYEANVNMTRRIIDTINGMPSIKRFVFISSQAVSGPSLDMIPKREEDPPQPLSNYGKTKYKAEELIRRHCRTPWTIIRPVSVFGEGDHDFLPLFRMAQRGLKIQVGFRKRYVNLIYIGQLCRFVEPAILDPKTVNQVLFASDGKTYCYDDIQDWIEQITGRKGLRVIVPETVIKLAAKISDAIGKLRNEALLLNGQKVKEMLAPAWLCSIDKAKDLIGWDPETDIKGQLQRTYLWYKEQNWL